MTEPRQPKVYRTRLSAVFASAAPKAVILRRGPRTHWHLINWDLKTDTFTHGQWMKGVIQLCDLSPDGEKLIYLAAQYHPRRPRHSKAGAPFDPSRNRLTKRMRKGRKVPAYMQETTRRAARLDETWTAISTPPYFTALALWPAFGRWTGGGFFRSRHQIYIQEPEERMTPLTSVPFPRDVRVYGLNSMEPEAVNKAVALSGLYERMPLREDVKAAMLAAGAAWVDFVHARSDKELLFAREGCLYRQRDWKDMPAERILREAKMIADFRDCHFELMPAPPEAMRW